MVLRQKLILAALMFSLISLGCKNNKDSNAFSEDQILTMLNNFYTEYITVNSKFPVDYDKVSTLKNEFCTARLIHDLENQGYDYDPFLNAQDSDTSWLNSLEILKDPVSKDLYVVSYTDSFTKKKVIVKLIVVKIKDEYKIYSIQAL